MVQGAIIPPQSTVSVYVTYNQSLSFDDALFKRAAIPDFTQSTLASSLSTYFSPHLAPLLLKPNSTQPYKVVNGHYCYPIYITNYTRSHRALMRDQQIGSVQLLQVDAPLKEADTDQSASEPAAAFTTAKEPAEEISPETCKMGPDLTSKQREQLMEVLRKNADIFVRKAVDGPPQARGVSFAIHTDDALPIKQVPYRQSPQKEAFIQREVEQLLAKGLIQPSFSPWGSPVLVVDKKDGGMRMCIDYRKLNTHTRKDAYPLPRIDDCLETLKDADFMTVLDCQDAYHHVPMAPGHEAKTAFVTRNGLYEWKVMPFGATGAPGCFQRYVDSVLRDLSGKICTAYFDDIVVYTKGTFEQHLKDVQTVFERLRSANLAVRLAKCEFAMKEIKFVGHLVTKGTIRLDPEKLEAITKFAEPTDVTHLKSFLGLANYYRRFINGFAAIAKPLYHLTKKDVEYQWQAIHQTAFDALKKALTEAPCLHAPSFDEPFIVQTDASGDGIGGVLAQVINGEEHPNGFVSRLYLGAEKKYATTEQEALAVVWSIKQFEHYLIDKPFTVITDHHALQWLPTKRSDNKRIVRWAIYLSQFSFAVQYRKGSENANADALSRSPLTPKSTEQPMDIDIADQDRLGEVQSQPVQRVTATFSRRVADKSTGTSQVVTEQFQLVHPTQRPLYVKQQYANIFTEAIHPQRLLMRCNAIQQVTSSQDTCDFNYPMPVNPIGKRKAKRRRRLARGTDETQVQSDTNQPLKDILSLPHDYTILDEHARERLIRAQHEDEELKPIIAYIKHNALPGFSTPRDKVKFQAAARHYAYRELGPGLESALFFVPEMPASSGVLAGMIPLPRLVVPSVFKIPIIQVFHDSPFAGHLGINKTYQRITQRYWWRGLYSDVIDYVHKCVICTEAKHVTQQIASEPTRLPSPTEPGEIWGLDYADTGTVSMDFKKIFVAVDYFTHWIIAVPLQADASAVTTARLIINHIICKFGCPRIIQTDNGTNFQAEVNTLCKVLQIQHYNIAAYSPSSNGMAERAVGTVKRILATAVETSQRTRQWLYELDPAVFAHNTSVSASTGVSPFFAMFGREARMPFDPLNLTQEANSQEFDDKQYTDPLASMYFDQLVAVHRAIRLLHEAKDERVEQLKHDSPPFTYLKPGDLVYLKSLQKLRADSQKSKQHPIAKPDAIVKQYFGPYIVLNRLGKVMYEIQAVNKPQAEKKIVHVSQLKLFQPASSEGAQDTIRDPDSNLAEIPIHVGDESLQGSAEGKQASSPPLKQLQERILRNRNRYNRPIYSERQHDEELSTTFPNWMELPKRND